VPPAPYFTQRFSPFAPPTAVAFHAWPCRAATPRSLSPIRVTVHVRNRSLSVYRAAAGNVTFPPGLGRRRPGMLCPFSGSRRRYSGDRHGRKPDPPIFAPFYAVALPPVEGTLHSPRTARRSVLRATREHGHRRASEPMTKGSTEQQHGTENRRPNYAAAAGCPLTPTRLF
jgi:hypothetical protein